MGLNKYRTMKVYQIESFVYKWTHIPTQKWYIGSRTSKNGHPNDGYVCSSTTVKTMIKQTPTDWVREILATGSPSDMRLLEAKFLQESNARDNPQSYNQHNNNGKFRFAGGKSQTAEHREKISKALTGIIRSDEYKKKQSQAKKGVLNPKQSLATKGVAKPNVSKAKKGVPQTKQVCRLKDQKEMAISHFNRWCNRQDNPEILQNIFAKLRGVKKSKSVCRLQDKKEMTLGHFNRWLLFQDK